MKSTIRIDVSPIDNRPVISIKSISSSDDLRDKALINFLSPIECKRQRKKDTYLHIQHKSSFGGIGVGIESGDNWEVSSFPRDMSTLNQVEGMYKLICFQTDDNFTMCNTGTELYFENTESGKKSENINIDLLEDADYHTLAKIIDENFKSIIVKKKK